MCKIRIILLFVSLSVAFAYEKDLTFTVNAGRTDCFYHNVLPQQVIDIEYQVIDASRGELEISFQLSDPVGRVIVGDYKKQETSHRHTAQLHGDYRFCFDNTFSTFSQKTIYFDLMIDGDTSVDNEYDEDKQMELKDGAQGYVLRVRDVSEAVARVREHVAAARRLQEALSAHEARDRNLAEDICAGVLRRALLQILVMLLVGVTQVIFVKTLFDDADSSSILRKYLPNFLTQSN